MKGSDNNNIPSMNRRAALIGIGGLSVFSVLASRLYYLQIVRAQDYKVLSDKNRFNFNTVIPERGRILDRNGVPLATNKQDFRVVIIAEHVKNIDMTLTEMSKVLPLSAPTKKRIKKDMKNRSDFIPVLIKEHLDWPTFSAINMQLPDLPGVVPIEGKGRSYPHGGVFTHVLGYVGKPSPEALAADDDPLLKQPTFRIGKTGVEQSYDKEMRGAAGQLKVEVNAFGRTVREWDTDKLEAKPGKDVWLTLDSELQIYAAQLFGEESGGAAVIDVMTGELRTLLSMPTFDGNLFVSGLTSADMQRLNGDPRRPQFNKVVGGGYPPASTFKMAVMLAALENNVISPDETVNCTGKITLGPREFHCWKRHGHGPMDMHDALKHSCDVYFYDLVQRMDINMVKDMASKLGYGQKYDLGIGGQNKGILPDPKWKEARLNDSWRTGDSLNASIGQGFVQATPLQLAVMAARLANGRQAVLPSLLISEKLPEPQDLGINPNHIAFVQNAMLSVCERPGGTAYRPGSLGIPGALLAGKTGTGQVKGISAAERKAGVIKNKKLPWKYRDHSMFVGFAPYDEPRFAAAVLVEHGGSGAGLAATYCRKILKKALERDGMVSNEQKQSGEL